MGDSEIDLEVVEILRKSLETRSVVLLHLENPDDDVWGIVEAVGSRFVQISANVVDYVIDGASVVPLERISFITRNHDLAFRGRLIAKKSPVIEAPLHSLDGLISEVLEEIHSRHSLVWWEEDDPQVGLVGRVSEVENGGVVFETVDLRGQLDGTTRVSFAKITKVSFGSDYVESLSIANSDPAIAERQHRDEDY